VVSLKEADAGPAPAVACRRRQRASRRASSGRDVIGAGGPATSEIAFTNRKEKTFAIWQFNDRVPPPSTRLRVFFGDGVAISEGLAAGCACAVSSSPVSDELLWASRIRCRTQVDWDLETALPFGVDRSLRTLKWAQRNAQTPVGAISLLENR